MLQQGKARLEQEQEASSSGQAVTSAEVVSLNYQQLLQPDSADLDALIEKVKNCCSLLQKDTLS